ncbi:hypothetical protein C6401_09260 [Arthrobacter woluwensis]|uniref:Eco57I restriction-modification methylase domain-containing protein n=1 Tax=Arthrobacter woluwensis TaxID=156980 RepID=UPI000D119758|nr:Eco57I restriction-modification methylase domain-containing protein [Arthrobacter woluwensis]PSS43930.1 hypothetical protein C6401_09260 [Arthrobacter woluwensis]
MKIASKSLANLARPARSPRQLAEEERSPAESTLSPTAAAVLAAIPAWWRTRASEAGLDGEWLDIQFALDAKPPFVLSEVPSLEHEWGHLPPEAVGAAYVESLDREVRAQNGRYYTPALLSDHLWQMTRSSLGMPRDLAPAPGLIRDPACGAGSLLLPALREHLDASLDVDPQLVLNRLPSLFEGIDLDPAAVWVANVVLASQMLSTLVRVPIARRRQLPALARVGDGLDANLAAARAIIMNPPYLRVALDQIERERFASSLYGHANLYGLFLASATEQLQDDGVLSAIVPTSFTSGRYFEPLRRLLTSKTRLREISFTASRSAFFGSVLQETCLASFTVRRVRKTRVSLINTDLTPIASVKSPIGGEPWILPRQRELAPIAAAVARFPLTLKSAGWRVSTGPLVWNRRKEDLHARSGIERYPIIWAADIDGGKLHRDRARASVRYIALQKESDRKVLLLSTPCLLVQRTTAPEQQKRLVSARLSEEALAGLGGSVVIENHVNVVRPSTDSPLISLRLLEKLFEMQAFDKVIRCMSGSVAISAYELESLPLPAKDVLTQWSGLSDEELRLAVSQVYSGSEATP